MQQTNVNVQETWLKVLGKGMVTLPKKWRQDMGVVMGDVVKAKKEGTKITIEPQKSQSVPYRIYSDAEIDQFIKEDRLPQTASAKIKGGLSKLS